MKKFFASEWADFWCELIRALAILAVIFGPLALGAAK